MLGCVAISRVDRDLKASIGKVSLEVKNNDVNMLMVLVKASVNDLDSTSIR